MATHRALGRRQRRLRNAALGLFLVASAALVALLLSARSGGPEVRRPGEALTDITDRLSQDAPTEIPRARFVDVTEEVGLGDFRSFVGDRTSQIPEDMGSGIAWGDLDNDGDDDLFVVAAGGAMSLPAAERAPSQLYRNDQGRFHLDPDFPELRILGMGAAWADYDLDGWLDLVVTGFDTVRLYRNEAGRLVSSPAIPDLPGFWAGAAWGDFDNDRDPDLYLCGYVDYRVEDGALTRVSNQYGAAVAYTLNPASFSAVRNLLFVNNGDGTFTESAEALGVGNADGRSLTALWHDLNDDGWLDLYVANDISDNALFLNRRDVFEEVGLRALVADYRGAMGLAAGDWNRDGDDDLFITHWVAQENALFDSHWSQSGQPSSSPETSGVPTFSDVSAPTGLGQIALPLVGWGTEFADLDGDGWLDLVVNNGSTLETGEGPKTLKPQSPLLLWNRRGEYFHDLAPGTDLGQPRVGRGLAVSDYDKDGDLDLLLSQLDGGVRLYRNDMQSGHWLELELRSAAAGNRPAYGFGDGTTVTAWIGELGLRRTVGGASYLSQSTRILHFGLGSEPRVDRVEVHWLGGAKEVFGSLEANTRWRLTEGAPAPERLFGTGPEVELDAQASREFWRLHRAGMDTLKQQKDPAGAIPWFERALVLDPGHGDARYYLANALASRGRLDAALDQLAELRRRQPQSPRAHRQWGILRAANAGNAQDIERAQEALERALELNPEETGSLLVLGEIALLRGELDAAEQKLEWACRSNPRAVGGFFLRSYLAYQRGDTIRSRQLLAEASTARGEDWVPAGAVAEGDTEARMHDDATPLSATWRDWDGATERLDRVFGPLERRLATGSGA